MYKWIKRRAYGSRIISLSAIIISSLFVGTMVLAQPADRDLGQAIWAREEMAAIIYVTVQRANGVIEGGTAFRVSPRYALTAKHLVEREDINGVRQAEVTRIAIRLGGPDGPERMLDLRRVQPIERADIALVDLGFVEPPPDFLPLGNSYSPQRNDFITFYGYGLGEPGAMRIGRIDLPDSENGQIRAEVNSFRGLSGAPVLNRRGNVIGVLSSGVPGAAYIVPIHHAEAELRIRGIRIPEADKETDRIVGRLVRIAPNPTPRPVSMTIQGAHVNTEAQWNESKNEVGRYQAPEGYVIQSAVPSVQSATRFSHSVSITADRREAVLNVSGRGSGLFFNQERGWFEGHLQIELRLAP